MPPLCGLPMGAEPCRFGARTAPPITAYLLRPWNLSRAIRFYEKMAINSPRAKGELHG